jgi:hypothetical protein
MSRGRRCLDYFQVRLGKPDLLFSLELRERSGGVTLWFPFQYREDGPSSVHGLSSVVLKSMNPG